MRVLRVLAVREVRDGLRNRWVLAVTLRLAALALALAFVGSAPVGEVGATPLEVVVVSLASLSILLLPLIALLLSFDAVVGEAERGTLLLLLAGPVQRWQVVLGKFLGQIAILAVATVLGYGTAALAVAARSGMPDTEAFAAFASDLDETSKAQLDRGARLVELLKQPQSSPMPVEEQVVAIFLGTRGHLDSVPVEDVAKFEREFLEHVKGSHEEILKEIRESKKLSEELEDKLETVVNDFKKGFATTDGSSVVPDEHVDAMSEDEIEKESVKVRKPAPKKK